jgi:Protein of unknown function (DUF3040)
VTNRFRGTNFSEVAYRRFPRLHRLDEGHRQREEVVPLSEEELRLLEQMERALVAEDPKFVSALRGTARRRDARRRSFIAGGVFVLGVVVLMTGAVMAETIVAVIGFVVMLASAVVALSYWRSQSSPAAQPGPGGAHPEGASRLTVMPGGKKQKKRSPRARQSQQSMMQRFEERWRRRRDSNGF